MNKINNDDDINFLFEDVMSATNLVCTDVYLREIKYSEIEKNFGMVSLDEDENKIVDNAFMIRKEKPDSKTIKH